MRSSSKRQAFVSSAAANLGTEDDDDAEFGDILGNKTFTFPVRYRDVIAAVAKAMQEAEAAQQALLSSGPLAEAAQNNQLLRSMLETYSSVQRLYHKAMLQQLQRHEQLAGSPAGLAYALFCEVLGQQIAKQPGDTIQRVELLALQAKVEQLPQSQSKRPLAQLACGLTQAIAAPGVALMLLFTTSDVCVMPDLLLCLSSGWGKPNFFREPGGTGSSMSLLAKAGGAVLNAVNDAVDADRMRQTQQLLLQACSRSATPHAWGDAGAAWLCSAQTGFRLVLQSLCACCTATDSACCRHVCIDRLNWRNMRVRRQSSELQHLQHRYFACTCCAVDVRGLPACLLLQFTALHPDVHGA
jgi:hypothetical protein